MISKMLKRISILLAGLLLLSACSPKMDSRIARGFELIKKENYQQAIELLQEVLRDDQKNINARMLLQAAYNEVGDYEQAIVQGKAVLKIDPNNQTAYQNSAFAYRRLERNEAAIRSYESLLALSPEDEQANVQLGLTLAEQGRYEEAIEALKKALRLTGEDPFLLQTLGICNLRLQRYERAIDAFDRIVKAKKTPKLVAKARLNIGDVYYTMGAHDKAIEQYGMVAREQDRDIYRRAQHYIRSLSRVPDGATRKIIDDVPFPPRSYIQKTLEGHCGSATLKMALNFLGDSVSQKAIAERVEDDRGALPYALWKFAVDRGFQAYLGIADISEIKYWIDRGYPILVSFLEPEYGWGHFASVVGYDEIKDIIITHDILNWISDREIPTSEFLHAWNYYGQTSLFIFPFGMDLPHNFERNIYAQNCLRDLKGEFLYVQRKKKEAIMELEAAILNQPPLPSTYAMLARIYANDPTKNAKANQYLSTALTMGPSNGSTLLHAGAFYHIREERTKALAVLKKGLELYPSAYELRQKLAAVYIKLRDPANAVIELKKLKTQCHQTTYCRDQKQINNDLVVSYIFLEDYGKAIEANRELMGMSLTSEEKLQVLGKHGGLGILDKQPEVVRESMRQILELLPEDDPKRQDWNALLRAMDTRGMRVDVKLEKDTEHGRFKFVEFYAIKSDSVSSIKENRVRFCRGREMRCHP